MINGTHQEYDCVFVWAISGKKTIDKLVAETLMIKLKQEEDFRRSLSGREHKRASDSDQRIMYSKNKYSGKKSNYKNSNVNKKKSVKI
jgi:hypothetical protein